MKRALPAVLFLLVLVAAPLLLLDSPWAARRVAATLSARSDLDIDYAEGTLLRGLQLARVRWQGAAVELVAAGVTLDPAWSWGCLLRSTVCLHTLQAERVAIELLPVDAPAAPFPPEPVVLPVGLRTAALQIGELHWSSAGQTETLQDVDAAVSLVDSLLDVAGLTLGHRLAGLRGDVALEMAGNWPLSADLQVVLADGSFPVTLPRQWRLQAEGALADVRLRLATPQQPELGLDALVRVAASEGALDVQATARGLGSLADVAALRPWLDLAAPLDLHYRGTAAQGRLQLRSALAGYLDASAPLEVTAELGSRGWVLERLALRDTAGTERLLVSGFLGVPGAWAPVLTLRSDSLALPAEAGMDVRALTARGTIALEAAAGGAPLRWRADTLEVSAQVSGRALQLRGSLSDASDQPLLALGNLSGSLDGLQWQYRRPSAAEPAALMLPQGVSADAGALSDVRLTIMPGTTTTVAVHTSGDLEAALLLSLRADAGGASWILAPFSALVKGEPLRAENPLSGRWTAAAETIVIEPFCLQLRATEMCSAEAKLGRSGRLEVSVSGVETFSGTLADDPFELLVGGDGELALRWDDAEFSEATLALRLAQVVFDPFVAAGTAAPISIEQVAVEAAATPQRQTLTLLASGAAAGGLRAVLARDGEQLSGDAVLEELSLAALTDLLPELDLEAGELSGELQLGGTLTAPAVSGELRLREVAASLPEQTIGLRNGSLTVTGSEQQFTVEGRADLGGGPLRLRGTCCESGALALSLDGEQNRLRAPFGLDVLVSPELRALIDARVATVTGSVRVHEGLFEHSIPRGEGVARSRDIVRVDVEATKPRRFLIDADLRAIIDPGFTLRSRQLEATLGGDLRMRVPAEQPPQLFGELQVLGGVLRAYGQGLRLDRGSVGFVGDPLNPDLNLAVVRDIRAEQLRVGVRATGTLEAPRLELFSEPRRPERETLSYLLRGRAPDVGVAADGTAMALALGASAINQTGVLEGLNALPGLSQVSLGAEGSEDDTAATISAYVGDRLYLSYGMGIYEPVNVLTARLYLRSRLWLEVVSRLESSFDLYYRFERN